MTTTVTTHFIWTPDDQKGVVALDVENTYTLNDVDTERLIAALTAQFSQRARSGMVDQNTGKPLPSGAVVYTPRPEESLTRISEQLFNGLKGLVERVENAAAVAAAQESIKPVESISSTKVNVARAATPVISPVSEIGQG